MAAHGLVRGAITKIITGNITELATGATTKIVIGAITRIVTGNTTNLVIGTTTKIITGTTGFTDTIIIIRGTVIPITYITTNHTITVMVTTLTLGFTFLPTVPGFISDSAYDAAQAGRMMPARFFLLQAGG